MLAGVLVIATVLSSAPFPVFAGYTEMGHVLANDTEFRLDGLGTHDRDRSKEVAAIEWLGDRGGRPVVLEAPGRRYQWSSSVSTMTGLPTLVGWVHHWRNYRPDKWVQYRVLAANVNPHRQLPVERWCVGAVPPGHRVRLRRASRA